MIHYVMNVTIEYHLEPGRFEDLRVSSDPSSEKVGKSHGKIPHFNEALSFTAGNMNKNAMEFHNLGRCRINRQYMSIAMGFIELSDYPFPQSIHFNSNNEDVQSI